MSPHAHPTSSTTEYVDEDDLQLAAQGYAPSFKREFSNLATISFAFSIMVRFLLFFLVVLSFFSEPVYHFQGLCSSVATTFNTPLLFGGPSSAVWCWIIGTKKILCK